MAGVRFDQAPSGLGLLHEITRKNNAGSRSLKEGTAESSFISGKLLCGKVKFLLSTVAADGVQERSVLSPPRLISLPQDADDT